MLAISPRFSSFGWFLDDLISQEQLQNNNYCFSKDTTQISNDKSINDLCSLSSGTLGNLKNGDLTSANGDRLTTNQGDTNYKIYNVKKLNHNARERDRRKRMNTMYSALRSLLPPKDQSRKLSIPATVSRVLKYIPELQKEVKKLVQEKDSLMPNISVRENHSSMTDSKNHIRLIKSNQSSTSAISVTPIDNGEILIQSSMPKVGNTPFSEALASLEQEDLLILSASSSESCDGRIFYNLHLQAQGMLDDAESLKKKLWSIYEKRDEL